MVVMILSYLIGVHISFENITSIGLTRFRVIEMGILRLNFHENKVHDLMFIFVLTEISSSGVEYFILGSNCFNPISILGIFRGTNLAIFKARCSLPTSQWLGFAVPHLLQLLLIFTHGSLQKLLRGTSLGFWYRRLLLIWPTCLSSHLWQLR